ncbi:MAG: 23S rRNA (uracil(1939)-C(5))-methyltransferase RlmD [Bullifex sp.]
MRKEDVCPLSPYCGGCTYAILPYEEELKEKTRVACRCLKGFGPVATIIGSEEKRYRDKVQAVVGYDHKGVIATGMYRKNSHRLIAVKDCMLEFDGASGILRSIRKLMKTYGITPFDEDRKTGELRHVLLRRGHVSGEVLVLLIFGCETLPPLAEFTNALKQMHPEVRTITAQVNRREDSMVTDQSSPVKVLYGKGYIDDELLGMKIRLSPLSFYQINAKQTEVLYKTAIRMARLTGKERVLDAYSGTGTIGLAASLKAKEVVCVELNPNAVADAKVNAELNGRDNITFVTGDASVYCKEAAKRKEHFDTVFLDPPRAGSDERFLSSLIKLGPESIIYISCDPHTQNRDIKYLLKYGPYKVYGSQPIDMFPRTEHVETVVLLQRKEQ